jgi:hypothetical protein
MYQQTVCDLQASHRVHIEQRVEIQRLLSVDEMESLSLKASCPPLWDESPGRMKKLFGFYFVLILFTFIYQRNGRCMSNLPMAESTDVILLSALRELFLTLMFSARKIR